MTKINSIKDCKIFSDMYGCSFLGKYYYNENWHKFIKCYIYPAKSPARSNDCEDLIEIIYSNIDIDERHTFTNYYIAQELRSINDHRLQFEMATL
jgi:hypothetical protein